MTIPFPVFTNQGWTCPKCGRVYAPWVYSCTACVPSITITIPGTGTGQPPSGGTSGSLAVGGP